MLGGCGGTTRFENGKRGDELGTGLHQGDAEGAFAGRRGIQIDQVALAAGTTPGTEADRVITCSHQGIKTLTQGRQLGGAIGIGAHRSGLPAELQGQIGGGARAGAAAGQGQLIRGRGGRSAHRQQGDRAEVIGVRGIHRSLKGQPRHGFPTETSGEADRVAIAATTAHNSRVGTKQLAQAALQGVGHGRIPQGLGALQGGHLDTLIAVMEDIHPFPEAMAIGTGGDELIAGVHRDSAIPHKGQGTAHPGQGRGGHHRGGHRDGSVLFDGELAADAANPRELEVQSPGQGEVAQAVKLCRQGAGGGQPVDAGDGGDPLNLTGPQASAIGLAGGVIPEPEIPAPLGDRHAGLAAGEGQGGG